jgi:predicted flap endonuclease-1-like 5' DNA nuclease
MAKQKQTFVNLRVEPGDEIRIGEATFAFETHPGTGRVYCQAGARGWIYKVRETRSGNFYALKVFAHMFRNETLHASCEALNLVADLPGMEACGRILIQAETHPRLVARYPAADHSVLMTWIEGETWQDVVVLGDQAGEGDNPPPLSPEECQTLALDVAHVLAELERNGYTHCDIAGANLIFQRKRKATYFVDCEEMYGGAFPTPTEYPAGQIGYRHREVATRLAGQWCSAGDRFAGAVLLAEIMCWHDPMIRRVRDQISYFADDDPSKPEAWRKESLVKALEASYPSTLVYLFEAAWRSENLEGCPLLRSWKSALLECVPERLHPPRLRADPVPEEPGWEPLPADVFSVGAEAEPPLPPPAPDDLRRIEGVGAKQAAVLRGIGILTFADLSAADATSLAARLQSAGLEVAESSVEGWVDEASDLAREADLARGA